MGVSMKVVAVISQKGGVSKTTIATALAVAAELDGKSAAVFDLDPQGSASFWKDTRQSDSPAVISVQPVRLKHMLNAARDAGTDLVILDAPPVAKDIAFQAAEFADFILIPTKPAVLDVMATTETLKLVKRATEPPKPSAVVMTFCPTQGREVPDTEEAIRQMGAQVAPVRIHNRVAYSRAQQTGLTALEFEPDGKAAAELKLLYVFVCMNVFAQKYEAAA
jgi:chromosome partitioning protein